MKARLGRGWRWIATVGCFAVFGVVGTLMSLLSLPLFLLPRARRRRLGRWLIHRLFRAFVALMRASGVLTWSVRGRGLLPDDGFLVLANHPSLIDIVFLLAFVPDAGCVVKGSLRRNPATAGLLRLADFITNDDPVRLVERSVARLRAGERLVMFPEGTRTPPDAPPRLARTAAVIALRAGTTVVPAVISCRPTTLTRAEPWYHVPTRRVRFELRFLPPIPPGDLAREDGGNERAASHALNRELDRRFTAPLP